ncbi:MAG: RNA polymerase sigma factor region1.1 domain-containing protein, partial [Tepidisphaeraceae bacterium]
MNVLLEMGTTRGYLTYEELNEKLPDEVVSPDKLDSLLMMIDEMGIKLIDDADVGEFQTKKEKRAAAVAAAAAAEALAIPAAKAAA